MTLTLKPRMVNIKMDHDFIPVVAVEFIAIHDDAPTLRMFSPDEYEALIRFLGSVTIDADKQE